MILPISDHCVSTPFEPLCDITDRFEREPRSSLIRNNETEHLPRCPTIMNKVPEGAGPKRME